jgi:hypothetical protein
MGRRRRDGPDRLHIRVCNGVHPADRRQATGRSGWKYLNEGRFSEGDRVLLLSLASGLEVGIVIFRVGDLVGRYGHDR